MNDYLLILFAVALVGTAVWAARKIVGKLDVLEDIAGTLRSIERHGDILDAISIDSKAVIHNGHGMSRGMRTLCSAATRVIEMKFNTEPWAAEALASIRRASEEFDGH